MTADARRKHDHRLARGVVDIRTLDRTACLQVDAGGPVRIHEFVRGQQGARCAVQHVEEAVLRGLHQHVSISSVDLEGRQHERRRGIEVPALTGGLLVVPDIVAGVGIQRDDRCDEQIVATGRAPISSVPGRSIGSAEVHEIRFRVIGDAVPGIAAVPAGPVPLEVPGLGRHLQRFVLVRLGGVTRHGVEAPLELAAVQVVRRNVTPRIKLATAVADDDNFPGNLRFAGDGVSTLVVDDGVCLPGH